MERKAGADGMVHLACYKTPYGYGLSVYEHCKTRGEAESLADEMIKWSDKKKSKEFGITEAQAKYVTETRAVSYTPGVIPKRTAEENEEATYQLEEEPWKMSDSDLDRTEPETENKKDIEPDEDDTPTAEFRGIDPSKKRRRRKMKMPESIKDFNSIEVSKKARKSKFGL